MLTTAVIGLKSMGNHWATVLVGLMSPLTLLMAEDREGAAMSSQQLRSEKEDTQPRPHLRAWASAGCGTQPGYLSIEHAAEWADVSTKTIKRWIKAGLPTYQAGPRAKVLVKPIDIDEFLNRKQAPTPDLGAMVEEALQGLNQGRA